MRIEKNEDGYSGLVRPGIGYIVHDAPAVGDIPAGAVWHVHVDTGDQGGEDALRLLDLPARFPGIPNGATDDEIEELAAAFVGKRSGTLTIDRSQSDHRSAGLFERVTALFGIADELAKGSS